MDGVKPQAETETRRQPGIAGRQEFYAPATRPTASGLPSPATSSSARCRCRQSDPGNRGRQPCVVALEPVESGVRQREVTWRVERPPLRRTISDVEHAAVGEGQHILPGMAVRQRIQPGHDAGRESGQRLPGFVVVIRRPRLMMPMQLRMPLTRFARGNALQQAEMPLAQNRRRRHGEPKLGDGDLRGMPGPPQVAAVSGGKRLTGQPARYGPGLGATAGI